MPGPQVKKLTPEEAEALQESFKVKTSIDDPDELREHLGQIDKVILDDVEKKPEPILDPKVPRYRYTGNHIRAERSVNYQKQSEGRGVLDAVKTVEIGRGLELPISDTVVITAHATGTTRKDVILDMDPGILDGRTVPLMSFHGYAWKLRKVRHAGRTRLALRPVRREG